MLNTCQLCCSCCEFVGYREMAKLGWSWAAKFHELPEKRDIISQKKTQKGGVKGGLKFFWKMIQNRLFLPWRSPLYPAVASFPTHAHTEKQNLWNCPEVPTFNRRSPLGINQIDKHLQTVKRFKHHWRKNYESFGRSEKLMTCSPSLPGGWSRLLEFRCLAWVSIQNPPIITCS